LDAKELKANKLKAQSVKAEREAFGQWRLEVGCGACGRWGSASGFALRATTQTSRLRLEVKEEIAAW
jgi:hypothetical protein